MKSLRYAEIFVSAYVAGYRGYWKDNPHPANSNAWQTYEDSYAEGEADRRAGK